MDLEYPPIAMMFVHAPGAGSVPVPGQEVARKLAQRRNGLFPSQASYREAFDRGSETRSRQRKERAPGTCAALRLTVSIRS